LLNHKISSLTLLATAALLLSACGSSGTVSTDVPDAPPSDPAPAEIQGVATPSSVAVVTATNAQ
jgi:hypothetical protein